MEDNAASPQVGGFFKQPKRCAGRIAKGEKIEGQGDVPAQGEPGERSGQIAPGVGKAGARLIKAELNLRSPSRKEGRVFSYRGRDNPGGNGNGQRLSQRGRAGARAGLYAP